jgi:membrane-associated phospholipid phosphatase
VGASGDRRGGSFRARTTARGGALAGALILLALVGWGAGELISSSLPSTDLQVVRDLATQRTSLATTIAHVLSWVGSGLVITPLAVLFSLIVYRSDRRAAGAVSLSTIGAVVIFNIDKLLIGRPRPPVAHLEAAVHSSFPSGHATVASALYLALLIVFLSGRRSAARAVAGIAATALLVVGIAASRVYLGVHYPTDVAAGVVLGALWAVAVAVSLCVSRSRRGDDARHDCRRRSCFPHATGAA